MAFLRKKTSSKDLFMNNDKFRDAVSRLWRGIGCFGIIPHFERTKTKC